MTTRMMRRLAQRTVARQSRAQGFGSGSFRSAFGRNPSTPNKTPYQEATLKLLSEFDAQTWYNNPVTSVINGEVLEGGNKVSTIDAFGKENGSMIHGNSEVLAQLKAHLASIDTSCHDYRVECRAIEDRFTSTEFAPELIAYQALDFMKQDGFTEIEEWVQAAAVERNLTDTLLGEELSGTVTIRRQPAFVGCVSNFSNFLDLSRKVLRNIEVGIPVVVLSRSNTTQHMYRWFQRLTALMKEHNIPASMATYASLDVEGQRSLIASSEGSPMFFTGSRAVAAALKEVCPNLFSATVGPNTMVCTDPMNANTNDAVRISSTIENAGQCTHVRHLVAPQVTLEEVGKVYDNTNVVDSVLDAIKNDFRPDGMLKGHPTTVSTDSGYTAHKTVPAAYRVSSSLPPDTIDEKWRQAFIDVTSAASQEELKSKPFLDNLAKWLVRNGPITLAVNGDMDVAKYLFERTSMTTYTMGTSEKPGLTVSARPQEYEAFGEFPARPTLSQYTKFPVLVPSATASYNSQYAEGYLQQKSGSTLPSDILNKVRDAATNNLTKGFISTICSFLQDACGARSNTNHEHVRTAVAGWQRPPLDGSLSVLRVEKNTSLDSLLVHMTPFVATNAAPCLHISCDPANTECAEFLKGLGVSVSLEASFHAESCDVAPYNVQVPEYNGTPSTGGAPLMGPFLALFFPVGHVKCLNPNDNEFITFWQDSEKWLKTL